MFCVEQDSKLNKSSEPIIIDNSGTLTSASASASMVMMNEDDIFEDGLTRQFPRCEFRTLIQVLLSYSL